MNLKKFFAFILLISSMALFSCGQKDPDIKAKVEDKYKTTADLAGIAVSVNDGVATLSGEVASEELKMRAETEASSIKGVKSVINNLTVSTPVVEAPVVVNSDDALNSSVRDAVKDHPGVNATVSNGVITLTGSTTKESNRTLMMKLSGLNAAKIQNNLTIK